MSRRHPKIPQFRRPQQFPIPSHRPTFGSKDGNGGTSAFLSIHVRGQHIAEYVDPRIRDTLADALTALDEGRLKEAVDGFAAAALIDPENKVVLNFGAEALQRAYYMIKLGDPPPPPEYVAKCRAAALQITEALCERYPDPLVVHNMARFLQDDGDDVGCIPIYERCLKARRDLVESWGNLGTAYLRVGRRKDADTAWSKCVAFEATHPSGHMAQGYIWVRRGEYLKGFQALNKRWDDITFTDSYGRKDLNAKGHPWHGQPLGPGESLLLHGEQGFGDHVMFARYIPVLLERGIPVAGFETRQPLKGWFDACWMGCPIVIRDQDPTPAFTHHAPIMSLPGLLGLDTIPPAVAPDVPALPPRSGRMRVGLVWKGAKGNIMDEQRTIPEHALGILATLTDIDWVPLQYDPNGVHALEAQMWLGSTVTPLPPYRDVLGLAEAMRTCDHVLTIDTLAAHVAGSLGIPSTVLHRYHREWRWGLDTTESPWYPNQRLVTCPTPDDWDNAMREVSSILCEQRPPTAAAPVPVSREESVTEPTFPTVTVEGRYGQFTVNPLDEYVGRSLIEYGEFSRGEAVLFADLIQPDWHVIEVGANIGAHTKQLTQLAKTVTAYEPNPENATLLRVNAPNAVVIEAACGNEAGTVSIDWPDPTLPGNFGGLHVHGHARQKAVQMVTLGDRQARFIKLDCEGMELDVLKGADLSNRPILYAEADHASTAMPLLLWLVALGYRCWWHLPALYSPENFRGNTTNVWGRPIMSINVLAVHHDQPLGVDPTKHRLLPTATTNIKLQP